VSTATDIQDQINKTVIYLVRVGLAADQNMAYLRYAGNNSMEVTFPGSENISLAMKDRSYSEIYENLVQERAFSAKMPDGALILMRYLFYSGVLQRHNLCFFPAPHLEEFQSNPEIYLEDELYADIVAKNIVPSPFRFDCDCRNNIAKPVEHPKSHFTLGQYENCRIPVSTPVMPYRFVSFVLRNFYHTAYTKYADEMPHFHDSFDETITPPERELIYFQIP
jgi:hypothetical protein